MHHVPFLHWVAGKVKIFIRSSLDIYGVSNANHPETMHYVSNLLYCIARDLFPFLGPSHPLGRMGGYGAAFERHEEFNPGPVWLYNPAL